MASNQYTIEIVFSALDKFSGTLDKVSNDLGQVGDGIVTIASPFAEITESALKLEAALAGAVAGGLALSYSKAVQLNSAMTDLNKVLGDDVTASAEDAENAALSLSNKFGVASTEVLNSITGWKQAGFTASESILLAEDAIKLLVAGGIDANQSTEILISTLKGFGLAANEAGAAIDIINEVSNKYATDSKELGVAIGSISPIAKQMGFDIAEAAGLVTPIIEVFRSGSEASNALRTGLLALISDAKPVKDALASIGVAQFDANGELRSGKEIYLDVAKAFQTMDQNQKLFITSQIVGTEQSAKMVQVFDNLTKSAEITEAALAGVGTSADLEVAEKLKSSEIIVRRYAESFNNLAAIIGKQFEAGANEAITGATAIQNALADAVKTGTLSNVFDAIRDEFSGLGDFFEEVAEQLPEALGDVKFDELLKAVDDVKQSILDVFGDVDLTTAEGITEVIQFVIDSITSLQRFTAGVVDVFDPIISSIFKLIEFYNGLDTETQKIIGTFGGLSAVLVPIGAAITTLAGLIGAAGGSAGLAAGFAALGTAVGALVTPLAAVGTALGGLLYFTDDGAKKQIDDMAQSFFGWADSIINFSGTQGKAAETIANTNTEIAEQTKKLTESEQKALDAKKALNDMAGTDVNIPVKVDDATLPQQITEIRSKVSDLERSKLALEVRLQDATGDAKQSILGSIKNIDDEIGQLNAKELSLRSTVDTKTTEEFLKDPDNFLSLDRTPVKLETEILPDGAREGYEDLYVEFEDGTGLVIQTKIDEEAKKKTEKELKELVPAEKQLEIQTKLDIAQLEEETKRIQAYEETIQEGMKFSAELEIADIESKTRIIEASIEGLTEQYTASAGVISDAFGALSGIDFSSAGGVDVFRLIKDTVQEQTELQKEQFELTKKQIEAEIELTNAKREALDAGQSLVTVTIDGTELEADLRSITTSLLRWTQIEATVEGLESLLGFSS